MAVLKLKVLASILAICAPLVAGASPNGESVPCLTAQTTTAAPYTYEYGVGTTDGTVIHTLNICTTTQEVQCITTTSFGGQSLIFATIVPSVPIGGGQSSAAGEHTSYHGQGMSSLTEVVPVPSGTNVVPSVVPDVPSAPSVPGVPDVSGGPSQPGYSPPAGVSTGGQVPVPVPSNGEGTAPLPLPSAVSNTGMSGVPTGLTTAYEGPSVTDTAVVTDTAIVTDSETGYDTAVSGSGTATDAYPSSAGETGEGTPTGTPTASGASKMLAPGAALGLAVMLVALVF
ncbi:hypothetical protein BKA59DRAFT_528026 [Fusarium tricinctum]|uniref:Cell wall protein n=2 Tax=Fusarium tricinctum species complex TaxID=679429 RepID=A0A8K0WCL3_9HYPO|nr:hypothetical protein BKA59DRAFT_528026 [Fusarium tricinctum]